MPIRLICFHLTGCCSNKKNSFLYCSVLLPLTSSLSNFNKALGLNPLSFRILPDCLFSGLRNLCPFICRSRYDTNDTREAPSIRICRDLLEEGAQFSIHDPKVEIDQISRDLHQEASAVPDPKTGPSRAALSGEGTWWKADDLASTVAGADAVLILAE